MSSINCELLSTVLMKERHQSNQPGQPDNNPKHGHEADPFWNLDEEIGEGLFFGNRSVIRLKAHMSEERYSKSEGDEIVPIGTTRGTRIYVMARPYILEPDYRLTIGVYQQPTEQGVIGEVTSSAWVGMRPRQIGQAQAWLYPQDRTLIIWEAYLHDFFRTDDPHTDGNLQAVWSGFEAFLLKHLPSPIEQIAVPNWEPIYEDVHKEWLGFLEQQGYSPAGERAFAKKLAPAQGNQSVSIL